MALPENVFDVVARRPTAKDAGDDGRVLWFHPKFGWHSAYWSIPAYAGSTHWTYAPEAPDVPEETPEQRQQLAFDQWAESFEIEMNAPTKAFANLVWRAACKKMQAGI
jgi:hypothetical protein